ncbi:HAD family hydrolase [Bordetella hinzii]|uniref:HAD family hydrolase n=1 Tax=Bordetella hinzii TaxID=103855 RepID=UPI0011528BDE|nr:HAD family hydrolase [Bordetella hinzii]QDJ34122.1 haloacid dehalogenase [Bordetella hinzii]QDJ52194.1 haloacid dehalogenase [Bordetella hinzii]
MIGTLRRWLTPALLALLAACASPPPAPTPQSQLPSWNAGPSREAIIAFVQAVTQPGPDYVPPAERIAVFDNDGTLWSEQPVYFQMQFALDQVRSQAPSHPEWRQKLPYKTVLQGDSVALKQLDERGLLQIVAATHTGMSTDEFTQRVKRWAASARHPRTQMAYTSMTFAPMRELLDYLRAHDFKTYIVSGGETDFMRAWAEEAYGIPPEQVIGSTFVVSYEMRDGKPVLMRQPKLEFNDDGPGKPVSIHRYIGRRPILAFGNSDGDLEMLQWTAAGTGKRFAGLVHHTDARREWAYDRQSSVGKLDRALDQARAQGWTVVDMKTEWKRVYSFEQP